MLFVPPSIPFMVPEAFAIKDNGDFKLVYYQTDNYTNYESWIQSTGYFESQVEWLNQNFRLPYDVTVGVGECGETNAFYLPSEKEIVYCYELMEQNFETMDYLRLHGYEFEPDVFCHPDESYCPTTETRTINVIDSVFYHEIGHAVIDVYDLPIPGAEEDIADGLAAYVLLEFSEDYGNDAIRDAAWEYLMTGIAEVSADQQVLISYYADEHSLSIQRFYNMACYAYGSDPLLNRDLVDNGLLPQDRAKRCTGEYNQLVSSWDRLLGPFMQDSAYTPPTSTPTPTPTPTPVPTPIPAPTPTPTPTPTFGNQWGTIFTEKTKLEIPFSHNLRDSDAVKIFGSVDWAAPMLDALKSGRHVYMIVTEPDGTTSEQKVMSTSAGYYENYVQICCNNIGKYVVSAIWRGHDIGTVVFDVVLKPKLQPTTTPTPGPTPEPTPEPTPIPAQTEIVSDSSFKTYTDDDNRFSIEYPDDWVLPGGHTDALVAFADVYDWMTHVQVFWNEDDTRDNRYDSKVFRGIETSQYELCRDVTFAEDKRECSDFKAGESYVLYTDDKEKVYFVSMTYTLVWKDVSGVIIEGKEYPITSVKAIIFDGDGSWEISIEAIDTYVKFSDEILYMIKSFSLDPTPVQTQSLTPDVITSDSTFKKYTFDDDMFSIDYPDNWILAEGSVDALAAFDDKRDWKTDFQVFLNEDDPLGDRTDSKILGDMEFVQWEMCYEATFAADNRKCTDFKTLDSYIMYTNDNRKVYLKIMTYTLEWEDYLRGQEHSTVKTLGLIFDGDDSWALAVESIHTDNRHSDEILYMIKSFSLDPNAQQQVQSTPTSTPTPKSVITIPDWIKVNARWWSSDQIPDSAFLQGIQFLIKEGIMVIPPTETSGSSGSQEVPAWIKNNAEWWAEGQIDDNTFVSGIQYLVKVGIIKVS